MDNCCPYTDGCPIFAFFNRTAKNYYLALYCQGNYARCQRRQLHVLGRSVPPDLLPYGGSLSYEMDHPRTRTVL